jgi:hypothetical protein
MLLWFGNGAPQEALRDAAECALISNLATDPAKRDLFAKLAEHHRVLATEVENAIARHAGGQS